MNEKDDKKMDQTKVIVAKDKGGLKPMKGAEAAVYGLEFLQRQIDFEKKKLQQAIFKVTRAIEAGRLEEADKASKEVDRRNSTLTDLQKQLSDRCTQLGLVINPEEPTKT